MYFEPRPKRRREDLYGRDEELAELARSIDANPLTVVTGVRRLGKTSLILVTLSERPGILVDLRGVGQSWESLYRRVSAAINEFAKTNAPLWKRVKASLKTVSGVNVMGTGVSLSWGEDRADLVALLERLGEHDLVVAFDEVQSTRGRLGHRFAEVLAHLYDHAEVRVVLSGSEVGLLYDFLGIEDPKSPLYGRYFHEVKLRRFDERTSKSFLFEGFRQFGIEPPEKVIDYAVEKLDGVVGWLVNFGWSCVQKGGISPEVVDVVLEEAGKLAIDEFKSFLQKHVPAEVRLYTIAKAIANGKQRWSEIKSELESVEKREITDATVTRHLTTLVKAGIVERIEEGRNVYYRIADPVLEEALRRLHNL